MTRIARIFADRFGKRFYRKGRERREDPYRGFTRMCGNYQKGNKTLPLITLIARIFTDRAGNALPQRTRRAQRRMQKTFAADLRGCTRIMGTSKREQNLTTDNTDDTDFH